MHIQLTNEEKELFSIIADEAGKLQQNVYAVGGFVRDKILGQSSKDIDFVTVGDGPLLAERVTHALGKSAGGF